MCVKGRKNSGVSCDVLQPVVALHNAAFSMRVISLGPTGFMPIRILLVCAALLAGSVNAAFSKDVGKACLSSQRGAGQQLLCRCIQRAADQTLTRRDQRRAADFFKDPDLAQTVRRSDSRRDEDFWDRYEKFSDTARRFCRKG